MTFASINTLTERLRTLGVMRLFCKPLAENDNSKQQIYLGGSFEVLQLLPHTNIRTEALGKRPNFKASLDFSWLDEAGTVAVAPRSQLILYPDYPEVRLSGFLMGCATAPSRLLQPLPSGMRKRFNESDGRVLFFGVAAGDRIFAYLASAESLISKEFFTRPQEGVLWHLPFGKITNGRDALLMRLREIRDAGWHVSRRLDGAGRVIPYVAQNGGGYTLEALLGIRPNANAAPDFMGWEIKAYSGGRVTLMTPEPDAGYYGEHGVRAFVRKYGRDVGDDVLYFTGIHRIGELCSNSGQMLRLRGFDHVKQKIIEIDGGIELVDQQGNISAAWTFQGLISHWARKHAAAAYVPYKKNVDKPPEYQYKSPVLLGEETEFPLYLSALQSGLVVYDPGSKITSASTSASKVKARSQFRIPVKQLKALYKKFGPVDL
jgi:MvaI/BcnI restriction endonuclease family